ncbi:MAG: hypothetical protein K9L86_05220 [Candidatus Omnitrophica bacterium]|nr:hypothetical protein [Candidatus Omnitrophota bacterium]
MKGVNFLNLLLRSFIFVCLGLIISCTNSDRVEETALFTENQPAVAKNSSRNFKLLILDSQTGEPYKEVREAMLERLSYWGYREGGNLSLAYFVIENDIKKGEAILKEQLPNNYDIIFINGTVMTVAAKNVLLGKDQVAVFAANTDPVGIGVIEDFDAPPKYNFTGVHYPLRVATRFEFIKELMPKAKIIGLIYADMPQSRSYRKWAEELFKTNLEFKNFKIIFRSVPLVVGEKGSKYMAEAAKRFVLELDPIVDVFLAPNDQMGVQEYFCRMVYENATKPLIGLGKESVMQGWGATMVVYPSNRSMGHQAARMIKELFEGRSIKEIYPEWPKNNGFAFDLRKAEEFGIKVPVEYIEMSGENIVK